MVVALLSVIGQQAEWWHAPVAHSVSGHLQKLTNGARAQFVRPESEAPPTKCFYHQRGSSEVQLTIERKKFVLANPDLAVKESLKEVR